MAVNYQVSLSFEIWQIIIDSIASILVKIHLQAMHTWIQAWWVEKIWISHWWDYPLKKWSQVTNARCSILSSHYHSLVSPHSAKVPWKKPPAFTFLAMDFIFMDFLYCIFPPFFQVNTETDASSISVREATVSSPASLAGRLQVYSGTVLVLGKNVFVQYPKQIFMRFPLKIKYSLYLCYSLWNVCLCSGSGCCSKWRWRRRFGTSRIRGIVEKKTQRLQGKNSLPRFVAIFS